MVSALVNNGIVNAQLGTFSLQGAVTGTGSGQVSGGTLFAAAGFNQAVAFTSTSGVFELAHGLAYTATISGFSRGGGTYLDLNDVGFVGAGEATFSGTAASGTLSVTDGAHTAHIALSGNYLTATFLSASDGHGGVIIHTQAGAAFQPPRVAATPHAMIAAIAVLGSTPAAPGLTQGAAHRSETQQLFARH